MRSRSARSAVWGMTLAGTVVLAFAITPVHAAPPPQANPSWGDITSVVAGPGLTGGALEGDALLGVAFGGNGTADTVARSDHDHDARYDARYAPLNHAHAVAPHNHDDLYAALNHNHDDVYAAIDHNHDDLYAGLNHNHDDRYSQLGHNHDDRYLGLGGGTLSGLLSLAVGDLTLLGSGARVVAPQLVSSAPEGTAPLEVASTTVVTNLNADKLDGHDASDFALAGSGGGTGFAELAGSNAFTGSNTFNQGTTFAGPVNLVSSGANFTWQPFFTSATAYSLRLIDSRVSSTRLVLDQNGRIGIGTTTPGFALHVVGDVRASNLNLGSGILSPFGYDMASSSDRTFSVTNSSGGLGHLAVEGNVSAAGFNVSTGGAAARAGSSAIASGGTTRAVATSAVGATSLVFVTADATGSGCVPAPGPLYVSARSAGSSFTVAVLGAAPGASESYCFSWWVVN